MAGLYIHIPFCKQACHYCNFHFSTSMAFKPRMISAICRELKLKSNLLQETVHSIYFGGGTPSLLSSAELTQVLDAAFLHFNVDVDAEITFETNPDDVSDLFIATLLDSPVNRLSMGIQSFHAADLNYMNRAHTANEGLVALEKCKNAGINNITADLIYGLPTLTNENWLQNIQSLIDLEIPHLSCYQLTVEEKTPLRAFIDRGELDAPSDEKSVEQFYLLIDMMEQHGYEAYEISNYAKPGHLSRHNTAYWANTPYLGFGPSAHSYFGNTRSWNTVVNQRYMEEIEKNRIPEEQEFLTQIDVYNEFVLTRLRTMDGISINEMKSQFPNQFHLFEKELPVFIDKKWVEQRNNFVCLTRAGKMWADRISSDLMISP